MTERCTKVNNQYVNFHISKIFNQKLLSLLFAPGKTVCLGGKGDFGELSLTKESGAPHYFWPGGSEFFFFWRGDHMIFRGKRNGNQYYLVEFEEGTIKKLISTD